jgi:hypothetical protein
MTLFSLGLIGGFYFPVLNQFPIRTLQLGSIPGVAVVDVDLQNYLLRSCLQYGYDKYGKYDDKVSIA